MRKTPVGVGSDNKPVRTAKTETTTSSTTGTGRKPGVTAPNKKAHAKSNEAGAKKTSLEKAYGNSNAQTSSTKITTKRPSPIVASSGKSLSLEKHASLNEPTRLPPSTASSTTTSKLGAVSVKHQKLGNSSENVSNTKSNTMSSRTIGGGAAGKATATVNTKTTVNGVGRTKTQKTINTKPKMVKVPSPILIRSETPNPKSEQMNDEENYDDDFEEDYQSDFEEAINTDEEEFPSTKTEHDATNSNSDNNQEDSSKSGLEAQTGPDFGTDSSDAEEEELQKSLSNSMQTQTGFFRRTSFSAAPQKTSEENINFETQGDAVKENSDLVRVKENTEMTQKWVHDEGKDQPQPHTDEISSVVEKPSARSHRSFDFAGAKSQMDKETKLTRSAQLMNLIALNSISSFTLFHMNPSPEKYVSSVSRTQRTDRETQMEGSSKYDQSEQTEAIAMSHKWTQRPATWSTTKTHVDIRILREEALGVGSETVVLDAAENATWESKQDLAKVEWELEVGSSWNKIAKFISRASRKVLYVLESQKRLGLGLADGTNKTLGSGNSASIEVTMNRGLAIINNLEMACLTCSGDYLACANYYPIEKSRRKHETKSVITVWSLNEPSCPKYFLRMWGKVCAINIFVYGHVVIAGGTDGGLAVWDLDESTEYHKQYQDQVIRTATIDTSLFEQGHKNAIVGLKAIADSEDMSTILSMDEAGVFKIWSLMRSNKIMSDLDNKYHTAYWSKLSLSLKRDILLSQYLGKNVLTVTSFMAWLDQGGSIAFVLGTMNGFAVKGALLQEKDVEASRKSAKSIDGLDLVGDKNQIIEGPIISENLELQKYYQRGDSKIPITSTDFSSALDLLIAGSSELKIQLYSVPRRKLLLVIECREEPKVVCFSRRRLSVFYVAFSSGVHIYDLLVSDKTPWKVFPIKDVRDFVIYSSVQNEFTVVLATNELKISMIAGDLKLLTEKENQKLQKCMAVLLG